MEADIQYALMKAAYEAWETNQGQQVEGFDNIIVIPDAVLAEAEALAAAEGAVLDQGPLPKFWIEHEGRRAQIAWIVRPHTPPVER
ncbi:hypothetical protein [Micromonospora sp. CPCC 205561]|uniref:hypothetical protein n=1 Tax=Micromonospora sp. CPCC 205561 TaxID=3122407 RepID=UPI002FEF6CDA